MDGDSSRRTADAGASAATKHTDLADGIHEDAKKDLGGPPLGEKTTGTGGSVFDAAGSIGKQFTTEGAIGGAAQKIGGPLDQSGAIGKQFTTGGSIGGMVQGTLGGGMKNSMQDKQ